MARIDNNERLLEDVVQKVDLRISRLISQLKVKNGRLLTNAINLSYAMSLRKEIAKEFSKFNLVAEQVTNYTPIQKEVEGILKKAGISPQFTRQDASIIKAFSDDGLNQLVALGNQYSSDIAQKVYITVASGGDLDDLILDIKQLLEGGTDKAGMPMVNHAQTIATTGYQEVDSILLKRKTDNIKDIRFKYAGSLIKDSRDFCSNRVGKIYTREEIDSWRDVKWQGKKAGDPFVVRGGWNCRHRWLPVFEEG